VVEQSSEKSENWETVNSQWETWFGRRQTISGKLPEDEVAPKLIQSLEKLKELRDNNKYPQAILDLWEEKFRRWLSDITNSTNEV
jgi:hypothetical protein